VWTGCGQRQYTPSRQQVAREEAEEPLIPSSFPTRSLSHFSLQISKVGAACSCCRMHSHWTVDCTGLDWALPRLLLPKGERGLVLQAASLWRAYYKVARSKQGITASSSLTCSSTAIAELTMGSNIPQTGSTDPRVTMQHKSGTA